MRFAAPGASAQLSNAASVGIARSTTTIVGHLRYVCGEGGTTLTARAARSQSHSSLEHCHHRRASTHRQQRERGRRTAAALRAASKQPHGGIARSGIGEQKAAASCAAEDGMQDEQ